MQLQPQPEPLPWTCTTLSINGHEALEKCSSLAFSRVMDIGSGDGVHAAYFRSLGKEVFTCDLGPKADFQGDYMDCCAGQFDLIWCCHVLEHQLNVNAFLQKCYDDLALDGWLAVTVPPLKHEIVGGHVTLWNAGLLLYNLILAGFDCSEAKVKEYGYNISVIVQKKPFRKPELRHDNGDIAALKDYFPIPVSEGFDGRLKEVNW